MPFMNQMQNSMVKDNRVVHVHQYFNTYQVGGMKTAPQPYMSIQSASVANPMAQPMN